MTIELGAIDQRLITGVVLALVALGVIAASALEVAARIREAPGNGNARRGRGPERARVRGTAQQSYPRTPRNTMPDGGVRHGR